MTALCRLPVTAHCRCTAAEMPVLIVHGGAELSKLPDLLGSSWACHAPLALVPRREREPDVREPAKGHQRELERQRDAARELRVRRPRPVLRRRKVLRVRALPIKKRAPERSLRLGGLLLLSGGTHSRWFARRRRPRLPR